MRLLRPSATVFVALALASCGGSSGGSTTPPQADPATVVPATAPLYIGVTAHPGGALARQALAAAQAFTGRATPFAGIEAMITTLAGAQVNYARDVAPWLGERVGAYFVSLPNGLSLHGGSGAAIADVGDHGKAESAISRLNTSTGARPADYRGVSLHLTPAGTEYGFVGPFLVVGSPDAVHSVIDTQDGGTPLSDASSFQQARAAAAPDTVAELHAASARFAVAVPAGGSAGSLLTLARALLASSSISAVDATLAVPSSATLALSARLTGGAPAPSAGPTAAQVFDALPGDSWLAVGTGTLGASLERLLATLPGDTALGTSTLVKLLDALRTLDGGARHQLAWAGPTGVFAAGAGLLDLTAGVVIHTRDDAQARAAVLPLAASVAPDSTPTQLSVPGADAAVAVPLHGLPINVDIVHVPGKVVIGLGDSSVDAALHPSSTLGSSSIGQAAQRTLGAGVQPSLLVDFPTLTSVIDAVGGLTSGSLLGTLPAFTSRLSDVVAGTVGSGSTRTVRVVLTLQ